MVRNCGYYSDYNTYSKEDIYGMYIQILTYSYRNGFCKFLFCLPPSKRTNIFWNCSHLLLWIMNDPIRIIPKALNNFNLEHIKSYKNISTPTHLRVYGRQISFRRSGKGGCMHCRHELLARFIECHQSINIKIIRGEKQVYS